MLRQLDQALSIARQEAGEVRGMASHGRPSTTLVALGALPMRKLRDALCLFDREDISVIDSISGGYRTAGYCTNTGLVRRVAGRCTGRTASGPQRIASGSRMIRMLNDRFAPEADIPALGIFRPIEADISLSSRWTIVGLAGSQSCSMACAD